MHRNSLTLTTAVAAVAALNPRWLLGAAAGRGGGAGNNVRAGTQRHGRRGTPAQRYAAAASVHVLAKQGDAQPLRVASCRNWQGGCW